MEASTELNSTAVSALAAMQNPALRKEAAQQTLIHYATFVTNLSSLIRVLCDKQGRQDPRYRLNLPQTRQPIYLSIREDRYIAYLQEYPEQPIREPDNVLFVWPYGYGRPSLPNEDDPRFMRVALDSVQLSMEYLQEQLYHESE